MKTRESSPHVKIDVSVAQARPLERRVHLRSARTASPSSVRAHGGGLVALIAVLSGVTKVALR